MHAYKMLLNNLRFISLSVYIFNHYDNVLLNNFPIRMYGGLSLCSPSRFLDYKYSETSYAQTNKARACTANLGRQLFSSFF